MASPARHHGFGLLHWMKKVVEEVERTGRSFDEEAVHDLRVAIRRCRSMAEVFRALDSDPAWKKMRRAGKAVFSALGELRDVQVQMLWVKDLGLTGAGADRLHVHFAAREQQLQQAAAGALHAFNSHQWLAWGEHLDRRQARLAPGSTVFQVVALEKWQAARALHRAAMSSRGGPALHALRIGVKRFRYVSENFLPDYHARFGKSLKRAQDLLGEVHDLDVLRQTAVALGVFTNADELAAFDQAVSRARAERVDEYRRLALGRHSVWTQWRNELPRGPALASAVREKFASWAAFRDADMRHTHRVLRFALQLFDSVYGAKPLSAALRNAKKRPQPRATVRRISDRELLSAAILGHEAAGKRRKKAQREWQRFGAPAGWSDRDLKVAALVARSARGPLLSPRDYSGLAATDRRALDRLSAIVRLAEAMSRHRPTLRLRRVQNFPATNGAPAQVVITSSAYAPRSKAAERITRASHLLQVIFNCSVRLVSAFARRKTQSHRDTEE